MVLDQRDQLDSLKRSLEVTSQQLNAAETNLSQVRFSWFCVYACGCGCGWEGEPVCTCFIFSACNTVSHSEARGKLYRVIPGFWI